MVATKGQGVVSKTAFSLVTLPTCHLVPLISMQLSEIAGVLLMQPNTLL